MAAGISESGGLKIAIIEPKGISTQQLGDISGVSAS
jgi:hypothetical protein